MKTVRAVKETVMLWEGEGDQRLLQGGANIEAVAQRRLL